MFARVVYTKRFEAGMNACYSAGFEHEMHDSAKLKGVITHMLFKGTYPTRREIQLGTNVRQFF